MNEANQDPNAQAEQPIIDNTAPAIPPIPVPTDAGTTLAEAEAPEPEPEPELTKMDETVTGSASVLGAPVGIGANLVNVEPIDLNTKVHPAHSALDALEAKAQQLGSYVVSELSALITAVRNAL